MARRGARELIAAILVPLGLAGCAGSRLAPAGVPVPGTTAPVAMHGGTLTLHLAAATDRSRPLVLFATGDGGWFGAAIGMFKAIAASGYPVAGFSARAFLRDARAFHRPLTASAVVDDYREIAAASRKALGLGDAVPVLLTGWSRGASLAVLVAAAPERGPSVAGVVAIGLTADERLEVDSDSDDDAAELAAAGRSGQSTDLYPLIPLMAPLRCVVIQATGDGYLSAADARGLFGADTAQSRFIEVPARNHRFSGGEAAFRQALADALRWVAEPSEKPE